MSEGLLPVALIWDLRRTAGHCGEEKWIQLSWRPDGENRKLIMKHVSGKAECEELSGLDMEQLMNE